MLQSNIKMEHISREPIITFGIPTKLSQSHTRTAQVKYTTPTQVGAQCKTQGHIWPWTTKRAPNTPSTLHQFHQKRINISTKRQALEVTTKEGNIGRLFDSIRIQDPSKHSIQLKINASTSTNLNQANKEKLTHTNSHKAESLTRTATIFETSMQIFAVTKTN